MEVPKLTSTKRKRYRPMEAEDSGRAAIARMAANKKPKPFEEVRSLSFNDSLAPIQTDYPGLQRALWASGDSTGR